MKRQTISHSLAFTLQHRGLLQTYKDVEEFVYARLQSNSRTLQACEVHLTAIRDAIVAELRTREIFIGPSIIDALLYEATIDPTVGDPLTKVLEFIRDKKLHQPGFVLYPLHSFGVMGAGLFHFFHKTFSMFSSDHYGLILVPQTNSKERTLSLLDLMSEDLGLRRKVDKGQVEHWMRSRPIDWIVRNPLLAVKVQNLPGTYYENQFFLVHTLKFATTLVFMLASLEPDRSTGKLFRFGSSRFMNNFQTLDIKHYLVFYPHSSKSRRLVGDCVPMSVRQSELMDLSDLNVELDPRYWRRRSDMERRLSEAIRTVQTGFLVHATGSKRSHTEARLFRKISDSLSFFRRSYRKIGDRSESIVYLAIAFEVLLTDHYDKGVADRISNNASVLLRGQRLKSKMIDSIAELYKARSEVVHGGRTTSALSLDLARKAYIHCFLSLVSHLSLLRPNAAKPITDILSRIDQSAG